MVWPTSVRAQPPQATNWYDDQVDIETMLRSMSVEEKVGQLLMIGFAGTKVSPIIVRWLRERRVGGVALFSRNIVDVEQTARFTRDLHALAEDHVPIFLALDQEGGNVVRVKDGTMLLPGNMALGATRDSALAYVAGQALAIDLRLLGFNMNLAPVLDVNSNPRNPVIGVRSYGERPELVAHLGAWYIRGQQEMGVVAVAKHFPGHGDTQSDSHFAMPAIDVDSQRLEAVELWPFRRAVEAAGLDAVMTAHIAVPKVSESPDIPATLSHNILTNLLRRDLRFQGVVITDGLEMRGIVDRYGSGRAAVLAVLAGADMPMILWTARGKEEVYQALLAAVRKGEISTARLNQSVRRILSTKARRGLFHHRPEPVEMVLHGRNKNPIHDQVARRIAEQAVTLVRNRRSLLPLRTPVVPAASAASSVTSVGQVSGAAGAGVGAGAGGGFGIHHDRVQVPPNGGLGNHRLGELRGPAARGKVLVVAPPGPFGERLAEEPNVVALSMPFIPSRSWRRQAIAQGRALARQHKVRMIVVAVVNRYHIEIGRGIASSFGRSVPTALISFASPYYLKDLPQAQAYVCTYSYLDVAQTAAARAVLGEIPMLGRLPISIPGFYAYGHRVETRLARRGAQQQHPGLQRATAQ